MVSERIKKIRLKKNLTQKQMADQLEISQSVYSSYENRGSMPPLNILEKLTDLYNIDIHWLITGEGEMENKGPGTTFPLVDYVLMDRNGIKDFRDTKEQIRISPKSFNKYPPEEIYAFTVYGDSMEVNGIGFKDGDVAFFYVQDHWTSDGYYIISWEGVLILKRLHKKEGKFKVISENPKYESFEVPSKIDNKSKFAIIGRVVGSTSFYE